ncbi:uncharacterized protein LOC131025813 [Salvia miltiorrhiza]|uniref:uncharacterized protein LOC131025813 n=1 Tax=Salvia miltiorrhiza TaxID=226208 RepID=UPI0025AC051D|nr:uncharacterized protein LOC131025813 [Salvia miltiorrhiza]
MWKISSEWKLIPMCKGFYILKFDTMEDKNIVKARKLWDLSKGSLRMREWVKGFNPYKEVSSLSQVWVRIYNLPVEFWHPEVITAIGNVVGTSIKIDGASAYADVGHYVRLLVEVDFSLPLQESMQVQGDDMAYHVEFYYEKLPLYCTHCRITGHSVDKCKKKQPRVENSDQVKVISEKEQVMTKGDNQTDPGAGFAKDKKFSLWKPKESDYTAASNAFASLADNEKFAMNGDIPGLDFANSPPAHKSGSISPRSGGCSGRQNHVDSAYFNSQNSSRQSVSLGSRPLSPRARVAQNSLGRKNENSNRPSQVREDSGVVVEAGLGLMLENPREISPKSDSAVAALQEVPVDSIVANINLRRSSTGTRTGMGAHVRDLPSGKGNQFDVLAGLDLEGGEGLQKETLVIEKEVAEQQSGVGAESLE